MRDLRANDERQQQLEMDIQQLGFNYRRKRSDSGTKSTGITSGAAAEAILAVWRKKPHQAKFFRREHFGKLYDTIFTEQLNGTQVILAVRLYRIADNRRRRPRSNDPKFVRYASGFIAMQMGQHLLKELNLSVKELNHNNFKKAEQYIAQRGEDYFTAAVNDIQQALYREQDISLQQLSATFRRGDLLKILLKIMMNGK